MYQSFAIISHLTMLLRHMDNFATGYSGKGGGGGSGKGKGKGKGRALRAKAKTNS